MKRLVPLLCLSAALALAGCDRAPDAAPAADAAAPVPDQEPPAAVPVPVAGDDAAAAAPKFPAEGAIGFHGFGPAAFGADQEAVRMSWGRDLGDASPAEPGGCYYLAPQPRPAPGRDRIAFMIDGDRFVRIDVTAPDIAAPGGGRVGMPADEVRSLYGDAVEELPHKYVEGGRYLRIPDPEGSEAVLLFETGADGRVGEWRMGLPPQVDWVERCG